MRDVDRYFEMVLGMAVDGLGGCVRTPLRLEAQPPFLLSCAAMELWKDGQLYRSLSPNLPPDAEKLPLGALGGRLQAMRVLVPPPGWVPPPHRGAQPLGPEAAVLSPSRLPAGGRAFGIQAAGRFVSWAAASSLGPVWNVTVETDPAHRGKGYAYACVSALTQDLLRSGFTPVYICQERNIASVRTAYKAGYEEYAIWRRVTGMKEVVA